MRETPCKTVLNVGALLLALACVAFMLTHVKRPAVKVAVLPSMIDAKTLEQGSSLRVKVGGRDVTVSVPAGEGDTYGTFVLNVESLGYVSEPIERDGSFEAVWVADVNRDGLEDGVFVIRNGGSGSYVEVVVLESSKAGFTVSVLPDLSSGTVEGYEGHDVVRVRNGSIIRTFPTYIGERQLRLDQQWTVSNGVRGEPPVKTEADCTVSPSGKTVTLRYDYAAGCWERL